MHRIATTISEYFTRWLNVVSLRTRILLGFVFVEAALVVFVITTQFIDGPGNPSFNRYEALVIEAQRSQRIENSLQKIIRATEQFIDVGDPAHLDRARSLTVELRQRVSETLTAATSPDAEYHLKRLDTILARFSERFQRLNTLRSRYAEILDEDFDPTISELSTKLALLRADGRLLSADGVAVDSLLRAQKAILSTQLRVIDFIDLPGNKTASSAMRSVRELQKSIKEVGESPAAGDPASGLGETRDLGDRLEVVLGDLFATAFTFRYVTRHFIDDDIIPAEETALFVSDLASGALERLGRATRDEFAAAEHAQLIYAAGAFVVSLLFAMLIGGEISHSIGRLAGTMRQLASGNLKADIDDLDQRHEIGDMAHSISVFKENAQKIEDMTATLRTHAEEVETALKREQELNSQQRQFVSLVSHEFRTPLAIIDGVAQRHIRRAGGITEEKRKEGLQKVRSSVNRLVGLMEEMLSSERLESGEIVMKPAVFDLKDLVREACDTLQAFSETHEIDADIEALPNECFGDAKLLHQVIVNLLSNAIKYSPNARTVRVTGFIEGDHAIIAVRDYGLGIPENEMSKLFKRFFRASTSTGIVGTGIGLHLIKSLIEMHGGEIGAESVVDEGSTFTVRFPYKQENPVVSKAA